MAASPREDLVERGRPRLPGSPEVPRPLAAGARMLFAGLSRLRGARVFHPRGIGFAATLVVERADSRYPGVPLLERAGEHRAIVRFSRAAGLPERVPDVLGLSLRLVDMHGHGLHQDFLLVTSADAPLLHHLLLPAPRGYLSQSYSSLLPYRVGERLRLVGAAPVSHSARPGRGTPEELAAAAAVGELRFLLGLAPLGGRLDPFGRLVVGDRIDDGTVEALAFNPWYCGGGIRPVGPLQGLRRSAYAGSQRGRGLGPSEIP